MTARLARWLRRVADWLDSPPTYETPEWMKQPLLPLDAGTTLHIPRFAALTSDALRSHREWHYQYDGSLGGIPEDEEA